MPLTAISTKRVYSIDVLRGIVMIIMALDHVRDYFHYTAATDSPTNLLTTTPWLFFTRFITHFCAPTFVFLAGISAYLSGQNKTRRQLSLSLIKRGAWLVVVEIIVVTLGWTFDPLYHILIIQVIWAIGISMIILGLFIWLPVNIILVSGLAIIFFHNLLDGVGMDAQGNVGPLWNLLHYGNFKSIELGRGHIAIVIYAFLPWTGIMLTGYGLGKIFISTFTSAARRRILFISGTGFLILFFILRFVNQYGDQDHWYIQGNLIFSCLSYLNVSKYPPSLDYICLTIGVAMIILGLLDRISRDSFKFLRVFGRIPFFFYVVHIYLIHIMAVILFYVEGYPSKDIAPQHLPFYFRPDHFGFGLPAVYLLWFAVIMILYPLCSWYDNYKTTHKQWWLSYM
jgi:uncharacterized membrane protein